MNRLCFAFLFSLPRSSLMHSCHFQIQPFGPNSTTPFLPAPEFMLHLQDCMEREVSRLPTMMLASMTSPRSSSAAGNNKQQQQQHQLTPIRKPSTPHSALSDVAALASSPIGLLRKLVRRHAIQLLSHFNSPPSRTAVHITIDLLQQERA